MSDGDDGDTPVQRITIKWSDEMRAKLLRQMEDHKALNQELCENPTQERQAKIGMELSKISRANALGEEMLILEKECDGLRVVAEDPTEDAETRAEFRKELQQASVTLEELQQALAVLMVPRDPDDDYNAIVEVRAAAGGQEAALFALDCWKMYERLAERKGWRFEKMDVSVNEMGGITSGVASLQGQGVYGLMKFESGVHRVQRVPATEGAGRVHTSTICVVVLPEVEKADFVIDPKDLRIDVMRAGGAGGQHVNTTESAVRIVHLPTGVEVKCADERSQHRNRDKAMNILRARLYDRLKEEQQKKAQADRRSLVGSGDRSERIRTYNYAQDRVTDHRISSSVFGMDNVLGGGELLDQLIADLHEQELGFRLAEMAGK